MTRLNRQAYQVLVDEDLAWLLAQPRTLERDHIEQIVRDSVAVYYPANRSGELDEPVGVQYVMAPLERPASTRQFATPGQFESTGLVDGVDVTLTVVAHDCVRCAGPCACGQVDPATGLGCRGCDACNFLRSLVPKGPDDFGDEDFPSQPSDETLAATSDVMARKTDDPVMVDGVLPISPPLARELVADGILTAGEMHACKGCQRPDCDCGQDAASCRECMTCSIPF